MMLSYLQRLPLALCRLVQLRGATGARPDLLQQRLHHHGRQRCDETATGSGSRAVLQKYWQDAMKLTKRDGSQQ